MISLLLSWEWRLGIQKTRHVSDEQCGILVLRPVIGIRIENELRVGQVLLKNKRIHRIDDHVIASVDHQRRVGNLSEIVKRARAWSTPSTDRVDLRRRDTFVHFRGAIHDAPAEPPQERPDSSLARLGRREENAK